MTHEELHNRIDSFSELEENWDTYGSDVITKKSIQSAHIVLDTLLKDKYDVYVFPMRDGGIQFENFFEPVIDYEIYGYNVKEIHYNLNFDIVNEVKIDIIKFLRKQKMERILR